MTRTSREQERARAPLDRDVVVDVRSETGVLVVAGSGRPRAPRDGWTDEAIHEAAAAERVVALDTGFPGVFRLRMSRHPVEGEVVVSAGLRCGARGARAGDERLLGGEDDGLPLPLPRGRLQVDVRTPPSDDPEAPDFVLTVSPSSARARLAGSSGLTLVDPARHPPPRASDPAARIEHRARLQAALRAAGGADAARVAALDVYLRVEPRDARALVQRAELRCGMGDLGRALDDAWRATIVAPNDREAWATLAALLEAARRRGEAARAAARARDLGGGAGADLAARGRGRARGRAAAR